VLNVWNADGQWLHRDEENSNGSLPFRTAASSYAPPSSLLPHIPLKPCSHSVHGNVVSDNHVTSFSSDRRLGLVDVDQSQMEGNSTVGREGGKYESRHPHHPRNFLPWPHHSSGMHDVCLQLFCLLGYIATCRTVLSSGIYRHMQNCSVFWDISPHAELFCLLGYIATCSGDLKLAPPLADRGVSHGQCGGFPTAVISVS
jgi:hypothetical protein